MIQRTIFKRPFYLRKYLWETILFTKNYYGLKLKEKFNPCLEIGENPRILRGNCFQVERPDARIEVGDNIIAYYRCEFLVTGNGKLKIGNYCSFGSDLKLYCKDSITIGNFVLVSWNCFIADYNPHPVNPVERKNEMIYSNNSLFPNFGKKKLLPESEYKVSFETEPVAIEDNVWIGANSIILKGVRIGENSIIGAGSVVTGEIPRNCIAGGNPAKVIREIGK